MVNIKVKNSKSRCIVATVLELIPSQSDQPLA